MGIKRERRGIKRNDGETRGEKRERKHWSM